VKTLPGAVVDVNGAVEDEEKVVVVAMIDGGCSW
jgi:hypothetical protein